MTPPRTVHGRSQALGTNAGANPGARMPAAGLRAPARELPLPARDQGPPRHRFVTTFGYRVLDEDCDNIPLDGPPRTVATISPNSYGLATRDPEFRAALQNADYLVLDGVYFGLAALLLQRRKTCINNGPKVFASLIRRLNERGGRVFFLGSTEETLAKIRARLARECPNLVVECYSPPFKPAFSEEDESAMAAAINAFCPDVVFVGMTAPKQEKWAHRNRGRLDTSLIVSVGAVFDWYAGNEAEIAPIWWKLHLGWLIRTIRRPEILKRYPSIGIYFWHLMLALLRLKKVNP
jgi:N-acetylglucosaminyldiphosphoundecaprenol N-acetyl-beta-D-mannosaminyltransferase